MEKRYMNEREASEYLTVSLSFLRKDRANGKNPIPFTRIGNRIVYDKQVLDDIMTNKKKR